MERLTDAQWARIFAAAKKGFLHRDDPQGQRSRKNKIQDGRKLRRYRRRRIVERTNAWLFNFRRLVVRYERSVDNYRGPLNFACTLIALRQL